MKSAIINSDNHVVKRTIASMPGGALPSGTDWSFFLTQLIYNLYMEKEKMKPKKADIDDDNDDIKEACIDEIGVSAAKKAGLSVYYTADPEKRNSSEGSVGSHGSSAADAAEGGETCGNDANDESEMNDSGEDHDDDDEHDEPTAPDTFFQTTLLVVLTIVVFSDDCDTLLNHAVDRDEVEKSNPVAVPS